MKSLKIEVIGTNLDKKGAYRLTHATDTLQAKNFKGTPFKLKGYAQTHNVIVDDETGETKEMSCLTIETTEGVKIGTNAVGIVNRFNELLELFEDETLEILLVITSGRNARGEFLSLELYEE